MDAAHGRRSRWRRLVGQSAAIHLVALDHPLALGWDYANGSPQDVVAQCAAGGVAGAVVHAGVVGRLPLAEGFVAFMQMHGAPPSGSGKVVIASPRDALASDCVGVAVEYGSCGSSLELSATATLVRDARKLGLVVLVMASYKGEGVAEAEAAIVGAGQLGADIIKVRLPVNLSKEDSVRLMMTVRDAPPVVVAGNAPEVDLAETIAVAEEVGARGTCVGRHYFAADKRRSAIRTALAMRPRLGLNADIYIR